MLKILTLALTAVVLTGALFIIAGDAYAKGGKGGKGGHGHHGHHFHRHIVISPVVVSSCWKWIETRRYGLVKVNVCD